jgi:hypothetical protein
MVKRNIPAPAGDRIRDVEPTKIRSWEDNISRVNCTVNQVALESNCNASMNQYWVGGYVPTSLQAPNSDLACRIALGSELVLFFVSRSEMQNNTLFRNV